MILSSFASYWYLAMRYELMYSSFSYSSVSVFPSPTVITLSVLAYITYRIYFQFCARFRFWERMFQLVLLWFCLNKKKMLIGIIYSLYHALLCDHYATLYNVVYIPIIHILISGQFLVYILSHLIGSNNNLLPCICIHIVYALHWYRSLDLCLFTLSFVAWAHCA